MIERGCHTSTQKSSPTHQPLDVLKGRFSDNEGTKIRDHHMSASFTGALLSAPVALISVQIKR